VRHDIGNEVRFTMYHWWPFYWWTNRSFARWQQQWCWQKTITNDHLKRRCLLSTKTYKYPNR